MKPGPDEDVFLTAHQLNGLCRRKDIDTLFYAGFMADICLLDVSGVLREMANRFRYHCVALRDCTVALTRPDGAIERYRIEPISDPVYLQGGGYWTGWDDELGRGVYRGDLVDEGETWDVSHPVDVIEPKGIGLRPNHYAEAWGRCTNVDDPSDTGTGHLESVVVGPYPGFDR